MRTHGAHVFTSQYSFWLLRIEFSFLCELKRIEETLGLGDLGNFWRSLTEKFCFSYTYLILLNICVSSGTVNTFWELDCLSSILLRVCVCVCVCVSRLLVSNSSPPHGLCVCVCVSRLLVSNSSPPHGL